MDRARFRELWRTDRLYFIVNKIWFFLREEERNGYVTSRDFAVDLTVEIYSHRIDISSEPEGPENNMLIINVNSL
jgi:hypothetical protein